MTNTTASSSSSSAMVTQKSLSFHIQSWQETKNGSIFVDFVPSVDFDACLSLPTSTSAASTSASMTTLPMPSLYSLSLLFLTCFIRTLKSLYITLRTSVDTNKDDDFLLNLSFAEKVTEKIYCLGSGINWIRQKLRGKIHQAEFLRTLTETFINVFRLSICLLLNWEETYAQFCLMKLTPEATKTHKTLKR